MFKLWKLNTICTFIGSGETFEGEYRSGKTNGRGIQKYKNGNMFIGNFQKGSKHGYGIYIDANGTEKPQEFKDGTFVREILL